MRFLLTALSVALAITPSASAQLGEPFALAGNPVRLDVGAALFAATGTLWPSVIGCARDANGRYWVTARRTARPDPNSPHMLFQLDAAGSLLGSYPQPSATAASRWGIRDLAWDGARFLYGGCEAAEIFAFDTQTLRWDPSRSVPVPGGLTFGTMRALAFDPSGDQGRGSLWVSSLSSEHVELDLLGNLIRRVPNVQPEAFGAALDAQHRSLWWFGQVGSTHGNQVRVVATEMDLATGRVTGSRFLGDLGIPALELGGFAGGVEFLVDSGEPVLLLLVQGTTDWIYEVKARFRYGPSSGGRIGSDGDAAFLGNPDFGITLSNSTNQTACLIIALGETSVPLPPPSFAPGAHLLVDLALPSLNSAFLPTVAGFARVPLPIPVSASLGGLDLFFQWVEIPLVSGGLGWPIATSAGGKVHLTP